MLKKISRLVNLPLDKLFLSFDKREIRRTKNLRLIPNLKNRKGGKLSYGEWAHVIGIFQSIIYQNTSKKTGNQILDIGCGTGLLGIAAEPFISDNGNYIGIDVSKDDINFCKNNFSLPNYEFIHFNVSNRMYARKQKEQLEQWPIQSDSKDLVTALSVWTHLPEEEAIFYFNEVYRVLKPGGKAIITFFYLDELYEDSIPKRKDTVGRFHSTNQKKWVFDKPIYDSKEWFSPQWVKTPENAIGISVKGMKEMLKSSKLQLNEYYPGNWKESPGLYFQDVLIFEKE